MSLAIRKQLFGEKWFTAGLKSYINFNDTISDKVIGNSWSMMETSTTFEYITDVVYGKSLRCLGRNSIRNNILRQMCISDITKDLPFTFAMRFKWETASSGTGSILFGKFLRARSAPIPEYECFIDNTTRKLRFIRYSENSTTNYSITHSNLALEKNTWYHLVIRGEGNSVKIFINSIDITDNTVVVGNYVRMIPNDDVGGIFNTADSRNFISTQFYGIVNSFGFWFNRELTDNDIKKLYNRQIDLL